jgi:hypothetical protein
MSNGTTRKSRARNLRQPLMTSSLQSSRKNLHMDTVKEHMNQAHIRTVPHKPIPRRNIRPTTSKIKLPGQNLLDLYQTLDEIHGQLLLHPSARGSSFPGFQHLMTSHLKQGHYPCLPTECLAECRSTCAPFVRGTAKRVLRGRTSA